MAGGNRKFEITIISAENLPDVRRLVTTHVYCTISLNGTTETTSVDWEGGTNPTWNSDFQVHLKESHLDRGGIDLVVNLFCCRTFGDRFIGQVRVPVKKLYDERVRSQKKSVAFPVVGTPYGKLKIRYLFEEKFIDKPLESILTVIQVATAKLHQPPPPPVKREVIETVTTVSPLAAPPHPPRVRREVIKTETTMRTVKTEKYVENI